jgi:hypothetical protein
MGEDGTKGWQSVLQGRRQTNELLRERRTIPPSEPRFIEPPTSPSPDDTPRAKSAPENRKVA